MIGNWIETMVRRIPRLPRKWRVVRNVVCSALFLFFIWYALETPSLTAQGAFRRAEQAYLLGPSEIIYRTKDEKDDRYTYFFGKGEDYYLVGRTYFNLGLGAFGWKGGLLYWEKGDGATLMPLGYHYVAGNDDAVQFLLFHEINGVVRAEVDLTITGEGEFNGVPYTFRETYTIEFEPTGGGVLTGWLNLKTPDDGSWESNLERSRLDLLFSDNDDFPAEIRLYDGEGNLAYYDAIEYSYTDY